MLLLTSALAALYTWTALRFLVPFVIPERAAILILGGVCYGMLNLPWNQVRLTLAVAGALVLLVVVFASMGGEVPKPWSLRSLRAYAPRLPARRTMTGKGHVPGSAPSRVGNRIPRL